MKRAKPLIEAIEPRLLLCTTVPTATADNTSMIALPADAVGSAATTTKLTTTAIHITVLSSATFTATVAPAVAGGPIPTGTVHFFPYNGTYADFPAVPVNAAGTASITLSGVVPGYMAYLAFYSGDANYAASTSNAAYTAVNQSVLFPEIVKNTLSTSIISNSVAKGVATVAITNPTSNKLTEDEAINVFALKYDGFTGFSSTVIGTLFKKVTLTAGQTKKFPVKENMQAADGVAGIYTLLPTITDKSHLTSFGTQPVGTIAPAYTVSATHVDLAGTLTTVKLPGTLTSGEKVKGGSATVHVLNNGNVPPSGNSTVEIVAAAPGISSGITVASKTLKITAKPGKFSNVAIPIKSLPTITPGRYQIFARVTDPSGAVTVTPDFATVFTIG